MTSHHLCHILLVKSLYQPYTQGEELEKKVSTKMGGTLEVILEICLSPHKSTKREKKALFTESVESAVCREVEFGAPGCLGWKISIKQNSESAGGLEAAFCQIQYHLEYWSKVIQNLKPAETGGNQNSFAAVTWQTLCVLSTLSSLLQTGYYYP